MAPGRHITIVPPTTNATVLTKTQLSCQPCQSTVCRQNDHRCMRDISAAEVVEITQRVLATASGSAP